MPAGTIKHRFRPAFFVLKRHELPGIPKEYYHYCYSLNDQSITALAEKVDDQKPSKDFAKKTIILI